MQLREFQIGDYPPVMALWQRAGLIISRSDSPEGLRQKLKRDADLFLVAEENDRIVGVIMGCYDGRRGWINRLAVAPDQRGAGLGSDPVKQVEERLKAKGCEKVNLLFEPHMSDTPEAQWLDQFRWWSVTELAHPSALLPR